MAGALGTGVVDRGDRAVTAPRLAFAPHMRAHVLADDGVALLSEERRTALHGRVFVALAPHLDGLRTADEIVAAVAGEVSPALASYALLRLQFDGLVVSIDATEPHAPAAPGADVVAVGVSDRVAAQVREFAVAAAEDAAAGAAPLTVFLADDYLRPELDEAVNAALAGGVRALPIRPVGRRWWFGPLLERGSDELWELLKRRVRLNRSPDMVALARGS